VVLLTGALSFFVYEAHPHVPDESQYLFQAKYMAAGQLTVKAPLVPEAFSMYMLPHGEPRWFGIFPPGWPAMLAIGTLAGLTWLVNPLLSGLCILLAYWLYQELYSRRFARAAILMLCCSPWFIFMGMSFMSHVATLALALAASLLTIRGVRKTSPIMLVWSGLGIGVIGMIRPLDAGIVGVLLASWVLFNATTWKSRILNSGLLTIGAMVISLLTLQYNVIVTGNAALSPSDAYYNKYFWPNVMAIGFGPERGMHWGLDAFPGHSPAEAVVNAALNVFLLNTELFGWAAGSLLLVILFAVALAITKKEAWAVITIAAVVGAYSLFWYHGGPDFGARYWFLIIIPLVALTIKGGQWICRSLSTDQDTRQNGQRVTLAVAAMCLISLLTYIPWRVADKYYGYLGMHPGIRELAEEYDFGRSLVIVRGAEHPDYQSAWTYNPVDFDGDAPVYALARTPEIFQGLLRAYGDRPIWIVNGPTLTGGDYAVVQGPEDARELLGKSE
jgi:hypothetical protein